MRKLRAKTVKRSNNDISTVWKQKGRTKADKTKLDTCTCLTTAALGIQNAYWKGVLRRLLSQETLTFTLWFTLKTKLWALLCGRTIKWNFFLKIPFTSSSSSSMPCLTSKPKHTVAERETRVLARDSVRWISGDHNSQHGVPSRSATKETLCARQPDGCLDVVSVSRTKLKRTLGAWGTAARRIRVGLSWNG